MSDDWTPEKEAEDDPIKLQKEQLAMGRELLDKIRKQEAEEKRRQEEYAACASESPGKVIAAYKPPTFEEVSAVLKKAWDEVDRIMPTAGDRVQAVAFQSLMAAAAPPPKFE
jgi:hypothetical protein